MDVKNSTADSIKQNKESESLNTGNLKLLCVKNKKKKQKRVKKVLWDIIKGTDICIMAVSERADKDKESESLFKKNNDRKPPNLGREMNIQIH